MPVLQIKSSVTAIDAVANRSKILAIESALFNAVASGELEAYDFPIEHLFAAGNYARTMTIPADSVVVGKIHKHEHLNFLSEGTISVMTEDGGVITHTAPQHFVSPPGTKRAVYTHTKTVWTCVHPTDKTDIDEIEKDTVVNSFEEYGRYLGSPSYQLKIQNKGK